MAKFFKRVNSDSHSTTTEVIMLVKNLATTIRQVKQNFATLGHERVESRKFSGEVMPNNYAEILLKTGSVPANETDFLKFNQMFS